MHWFWFAGSFYWSKRKIYIEKHKQIENKLAQQNVPAKFFINKKNYNGFLIT